MGDEDIAWRQWNAWLRNKVLEHLKKENETYKVRTLRLIQLQKDLFKMTTTTVLRNLVEEGRYTITPEIRQEFEDKKMYEEALAKDIPWRQWNAHLRSKVITFIKN